MPGLNIDDLLAHREWVGRVARTLVHGDAEAEDLEQRAWVRVLEHPPAEAPRSPRGWLYRVLRFAAIDGARAERTRRGHEAAAAARERADAPPDSLVARAEIHERLVHTVLELEEPYRATILLRYFEELPPREISSRQGVPVETVRTRIKRALEQLRGSLGGDRGREGLLLSLAPLLLPEGKTVAAGTAGGMAMGAAAKIGLAAGAVVLAAGGVVAWQASMEEPVVGPKATTVAPSVSAPRPAVNSPPPVAEPAVLADPPNPAVMGTEPPGPSIEDRLNEKPEELDFQGLTIGIALKDLAERLRLAPRYESDLLEQTCFATPFPAKFQAVQIRVVLDMAVANVKSPVEAKKVAWEVRKDRLFIHLVDPPPPGKEGAAAAKEREEKETALLARIRSEKTAFDFDGQTLAEACSYLSARHGINIVLADSIRERADTLVVKFRLKDVPIADALDQLLMLLDPDLLWEVKGNGVIVRKR